jgi:hypothetical protein
MMSKGLDVIKFIYPMNIIFFIIFFLKIFYFQHLIMEMNTDDTFKDFDDKSIERENFSGNFFNLIYKLLFRAFTIYSKQRP